MPLAAAPDTEVLTPAELPPGTSPRLHDVARWVGSWCFRPFLQVQVHHGARIPATGPVVLVANHSAMIDGPLLFGLLRRRAVFLAKQEMFRGPLAWLLPTDRAARRASGPAGPRAAARGCRGPARRWPRRDVSGGNPRQR